MHILIISASVRQGRQSHRVALFLEQFIRERQLATVEIADLEAYQFPVFDERLVNLTDAPAAAHRFSEQIQAAQAVIIVTPEYNSGYPASLKNAIDLITFEWVHKPIGLATASSGVFGGNHAQLQLLPLFLKLKALIAPAVFPCPQVQDNFDEKGKPRDEAAVHKRAQAFLNELLWLAKAVQSAS